MKRAVMAAYRPRANDIAVSVDHGGEYAHIALQIDEARAIHGALGLALRCADAASAGEPLAALPGGV